MKSKNEYIVCTTKFWTVIVTTDLTILKFNYKYLLNLLLTPSDDYPSMYYTVGQIFLSHDHQILVRKKWCFELFMNASMQRKSLTNMKYPG